MLLEYERQAAENPQRPAALMPPPEAVDGEEGEGEGAVVAVDPNEVGRYCEHVRAGAPLLAHGMCRGCLEDYLKITLATQVGGRMGVMGRRGGDTGASLVVFKEGHVGGGSRTGQPWQDRAAVAGEGSRGTGISQRVCSMCALCGMCGHLTSPHLTSHTQCRAPTTRPATWPTCGGT